MSYVGRKKNKSPGLGTMTHRVVLCSMRDVVDENGDIRLTRDAALKQWAKIEEKSGSMFSADGQAIKEDRERQSHVVTVRAIDGVEISSAAWVYEHRERRAPRWFKVLSVQEQDNTGPGPYGMFWRLSCRIYERTDEASKPVGPARETTSSLTVVSTLPSDVQL